MPANQWIPPQTGDRQLDYSFNDLASRLAGMDALLASIAVPTVRIVRASAQIGDELYVEYRGPGGHVITLPPADTNGTGRGTQVTIQNRGQGSITIRSFSSDTLNGVNDAILAVSTGNLFSSNGVNAWTAPSGTAGSALVIQDHDVDASPQRPRLNFIGDLVVADNPGNNSTDVGVTLPDSGVSDPWMALKPHGIYIPAGVVRDGAGGDDASWADSQGAAATWQPDTYIFAYPEVAPFDGTIDSLATYLSGGGGPKFWIGIARDTVDPYTGLNHYPGSFAAIFAYTHVTGFDGQKLRTGAVSVSVTKGEIFWICFQGDSTQPCMGNRLSTCFRNVFGNNTPATWSATNTRGQIGWVTTAAVTYNAALSAFPTSSTEILTMGSKPYTLGAGNTALRPATYIRYA